MNLHSLASQIIPQYPFTFNKYLGKTVTAAGVDTPQYGPDAGGTGSVQPVPRSVYQTLGLNEKKTYIMIYTGNDLRGLANENYGDLVTWDGDQYMVMDENNWFSVSDWAGVMCVKL